MDKIKVKFPARISLNLFTYPDKLVKGGYGIAIKMNNYLTIIKSQKDNIRVKSKEKNVDILVRYYLDEFRKISNSNFKINILLELDDRFINHVGLAFNSNIACALFFALNNMLENKFTKKELLKLLFNSYAELDNGKITKNDSTCMISQYCALYGGMNIIDDLNLIYNYKFPKNFFISLIHFDNLVKDIDTKKLKEKKKNFITMDIKYIRNLFYNTIIPELDNDNIKSLKDNNLNILKGSTRILRFENYMENDKMQIIMKKLSTIGIVGITSSSATIYFISTKKYEGENLTDYYEIDNDGIIII